MTKVTLDREAFKALASDTRLDILRTLDGKKMSLTEISRATNLNKATLHEHLSKLLEADLVKRKDREGHKWVYYKLSWKGESLLHPENTKIVVMFSIAFVTLMAGIVQMFLYAKGTIQSQFDSFSSEGEFLTRGASDTNESLPYLTNTTEILEKSINVFDSGGNGLQIIYQEPLLLYASVICFLTFLVIFALSIWYVMKNKTPKL